MLISWLVLIGVLFIPVLLIIACFVSLAKWSDKVKDAEYRDEEKVRYWE
jgi:hypothetical protein